MAKKPMPKKRATAQHPASAKSKPSAAKFRNSALEAEIRKTDKEILKLVNHRALVTSKYFQNQETPRRAMFAPQLEEDLRQLIETNNSGPLPAPAARAVFREIISGARSLLKTMRVAYLGPSYSFTHLAAIERFGNSAEYIPVNSIAAVFEEVNRGHADYGIAPIENSTDGRVVDTLDMFTKLPLKICAEVQLAIHHNLMAKCSRGEVIEVYSKPQALSQCRDWLARNMPQARLIEVTSTSTAAQLARDKHGAAAIASRQAAAQYDLTVLVANIEDNKNNVTRFAVIGDETTRPTGHDKTAVLMQIPHKPGTLAESLTTFRKAHVNLTWIESFPLRGPEVGYYFFLEFEGHTSDSRIKRTLAELERRAVRLEILGSYPRSSPIE
jgi:chorismate mutase/prephenate dehydratase